MSLDKDLINKLVKVTSRAAINCYQFLGKGNKKIADKAATDSMRTVSYTHLTLPTKQMV